MTNSLKQGDTMKDRCFVPNNPGGGKDDENEEEEEEEEE